MGRYIDAVPQYFDGAGDPLVNGKLTFYKAGTTSLLKTYADAESTILNTNPVKLDAAGRTPDIYFDGAARVVLTSDNIETCEYGKQWFDRSPVFSTSGDDGEDPALSLTLPYVFNTVADMTSSTISLPVGKPLETKGYYDAGESGAAKYLVKIEAEALSDGDVLDGYGNLQLASGNWAILQTEGSILCTQYGAKDDEAFDSYQQLQSWVNACRLSRKTALLDVGTFMTSQTILPAGDFNTSLYEFSMVGCGLASILKTNAPDLHMISTDSNQQHANVTFEKFTMINSGDVSTAERHCLNMYHTTNLLVKDMLFINTKGDGAYLRDIKKSLIKNIYCKDTRRQGVALSWGSEVTVDHVRGEGEFINLVDAEPNPGDTIDKFTIKDVKYTDDATISSVRILGQASATTTNVTLIDIQANTLAANYVDGLFAHDLVLNSNTIFDTLTLDNVNSATLTGINMPDQSVASGRVKATGCTDVTITGLVADCVGDSGISVDLLNCEDFSINGKLKNPSNFAYRVRDSSDVTISGKVVGATTALLLNPTTQNEDIQIKDLTLKSCTNGISINGDNGLFQVSHSDFRGAATPLVFGTFTANFSFTDVKGLQGIYWGALPTSGDFVRGDKVYRDSPSAGGNIGWVCISSGSPGTWREFGDISV